jgi:hypothetical protein
MSTPGNPLAGGKTGLNDRIINNPNRMLAPGNDGQFSVYFLLTLDRELTAKSWQNKIFNPAMGRMPTD